MASCQRRARPSAFLNHVVTIGLMVTATALPLASAAAAGPRCNPCDESVTGNGASLDVAVIRGVSDTVPNRGNPATHGEAPGRREWLRVEEKMAPACQGNTLNGGDQLCTFAVTTCADDQLRYWVWHREVRVTVEATGERTETVERDWYQEPASFCLGPDDPGVPTIGQVLAQVQTEFQRLPLPSRQVQTAPSPTTLVNVPTAFAAGDAQPQTFTPTILGTTVAITATPTSWAWTFGDGAITTTTTPGRPGRPDVAHVYTGPGDHTANVRVTWTGTFTVEGSPQVYDIRAPAFVQGAPSAVQVREARSQLVAP